MEPHRSDLDLSVLIATRDRAASLARTLEALSVQTLAGRSWEVIVVDNGSTDITPCVLADAAKTLPLVSLVEPTPGKNKALNRALDVARGRLCLFTDDDVIPDRTWAATLYGASRRWPEDSIFGGAIQPRFPESAPAWLSGNTFPYSRWAFGQYAPRLDEGPTGDTPLGSNLAIQNRVFRHLRFNESMGPNGGDYPMGSEVDLLLRLYRRGEQFIFVPSAKVEHVLAEHAVTTNHLTGRAYRCGRGNARLLPEAGNFPFFGIPLYTVKQSLKALAAAAVLPLRSEQDRCIALLTLHQLRGEITERRRMLASLGVRARQFPGVASFGQAIKRRGFVGAILTPVRWALAPFVRYDVHQFFECNIDQPLPELPNTNGIRVAVLYGEDQSRTVRVALCPIGILEPEQIDDRLAQGHAVAIAWSMGRAVGYAWSAYSDLLMSEVDSTIRVGPSDMVGYDAWVSPGWRGSGILPHLDAALIAEAARRGRKRQLISTCTRNRATVRSMTRTGKRRLFKIAYVCIPLFGWKLKLALGAPYSAYFTNSLPRSRAHAYEDADTMRRPKKRLS